MFLREAPQSFHFYFLLRTACSEPRATLTKFHFTVTSAVSSLTVCDAPCDCDVSSQMLFPVWPLGDVENGTALNVAR